MPKTEADESATRSSLLCRIEEAEDEGDYKVAARLYAQLIEKDPEDEELRLKEISSLDLSHDWDEADKKARIASEHFPSSVNLAVMHARMPMRRHDWQRAIDRFEAVRASFRPEVHFEAARTIIDQFYCLENMADSAGARRLIDRYWDVLKKYKASLYPICHQLFDIGNFISAERVGEYQEWAVEAAPTPPCYLHRVGTAAWNRRWMERHAPDAVILALGQNCLPWVVPNRWGMRPDHHTMSPVSPFDFLGMPNDSAAVTIEHDFRDMLKAESLVSSTDKHKVHTLFNRDFGTQFFHERGIWWEADHWRRLHLAYEHRIKQFRSMKRKNKRLFVYCLCGAGDPARIVQAYRSCLDDRNARLLIINVLKQPLVLEEQFSRVTVKNIPYPEDYNWNHIFDYETLIGHQFELAIISEIRAQLMQMKDYKTYVIRCKNGVKGIVENLIGRRKTGR